jgi:hypothetical protein
MNDVVTQAQVELQQSKEFKAFESKWKKILVGGKQKSREWLFRHARELYEFRCACDAHEVDGLPRAAKQYFTSSCEAWLGYSDTTVSNWVAAGQLIATRLATVFPREDELPASMRTLSEIARLTDDELAQAISLKLIHAETKREEIEDFKRSLRADKKEQEQAKDKQHKQRTAEVEDDLLTFKYDDNIPEFIIEKIEDMAAELGSEKFKEAHTLKFPETMLNGQETIWICTLHKNTWSGIQVLRGQEPKEEKTEKPKHKPKHVLADAFLLLGIEIDGNGYIDRISDSALAGLVKAARQQNHPDKGGTDEKFVAITKASESIRQSLPPLS